jgi:hypothetical protein
MSRKRSLQQSSRETWPSSLDDGGYVVFPDVVPPRALADMRDAFERAAARAAREGGTRHAEIAGEPAFAVVHSEPRVLAAAEHVLGRPFTLRQLSGRDPLPGFGQQGLHADWRPRAAWEPYSVVTALWLLDDFTPDNGATRVVPGSHRMSGMVPRNYADPEAHHGGERVVIAPAGSVLVFNGHLWHSGTRNRTSGPRRVVQCIFGPPDPAGA